MKNLKKGFTLSEVLITLGVIGVVSAITMPTLIQNYQKQKTVNELKLAYSTLYQAIKMSELDNGHVLEWDYSTLNDNDTTTYEVWINKYIAPYLKYTKIEGKNIYLVNGTIITFGIQGHPYITLVLTLNSKKNNKFLYYLGKPAVTGRTNVELRPYEYTIDVNKTPAREDWIGLNSSYGCNPNGNKTLCAGLIMHDGWQIKDDYPW